MFRFSYVMWSVIHSTIQKFDVSNIFNEVSYSHQGYIYYNSVVKTVIVWNTANLNNFFRCNIF